MRLLVPVILALSLCGCYSQLTGNLGQLTFAYPANSEVENFNKPLAPGARLDLHVREPGSEDALRVTGASSSDPSVIEIVESWERGVVLVGRANGTARVTVHARFENGATVTDVVDMHVARPDRMYLGHSCTEGDFAVYPANSEIQIPFGMASGKKPSIGYGFWPIKVSPASSLELKADSREQSVLELKTGASRHRVAIRSRIDDTLLGMALAEPTEVDGVAYPADELPPLLEGQRAIFQLQPTVANVPFCGGRVPTLARSLTSDTCVVSAQVEPGGPDKNTESLVRIDASKFGICRFVVEYPDAAGGAGVREEFELRVGKLPTLGTVTDDASIPWWLAPLLALVAPLSMLPLVQMYRRG